jgi:replicative DNA helicase
VTVTDDHNTTTGGPSVFHDHAAERAVLGALLLDGKLIGEVESILEPASFHRPGHGLIFDTLCRMRADNQPTDSITVGRRLVDDGLAGRLPDGVLYLHTLTKAVPTSANGVYYAGIVADRALLRDLDASLGDVRAKIRAGGHGSPAELVEQARTLISDLGARAAGVGGPERWRDMIRPGLDAIEAAEDNDGGPPGLSTGLPDLDKMIHGLQKQRLIVVAGQPGGGKSTLGAGDFIRAVAFKHKIPAALFTMEMPKLEMFNRLVCAESGVPSDKVISGTLDSDDWVTIARMCGDTEDAPLWIDDTKGLTMADIRVRARRLRQQHDLQLVVIDYLGLLEGRPGLPRNQQIDELTRAAKNLAGELDLPVVLLAQLNRNAAQRGDKRPILTDLKESGGIEAHADVVIFVHREEQYDKTKRVGEADLIVAKNRGGPLGDVQVAAQLHLNRFMSMALPERTN